VRRSGGPIGHLCEHIGRISNLIDISKDTASTLILIYQVKVEFLLPSIGSNRHDDIDGE
jgi:hypothetical protein